MIQSSHELHKLHFFLLIKNSTPMDSIKYQVGSTGVHMDSAGDSKVLQICEERVKFEQFIESKIVFREESMNQLGEKKGVIHVGKFYNWRVRVGQAENGPACLLDSVVLAVPILIIPKQMRQMNLPWPGEAGKFIDMTYSRFHL